MKTLRTFVAIELTDELKHSIQKVIHCYQELVPAGLVKWVATRNLHITIKFLGDTPISLIPSIQEKMDQLASKESDFWMTAAGAGMFPTARKPRVIWLGLNGKTELSRISQELDDFLTGLNFSREERPFSPHLTIGRVYQGVEEQKLLTLGKIILGNQPGILNRMLVKNISLIKSDLHPDGPIYTTIHTSELLNTVNEEPGKMVLK